MPKPDEIVEMELGRSDTLEHAFGAVLEEVFEAVPFPVRGSWSMATEVDANLDERRITLHIELRLRESGPAAAGMN